MSSPNIVAPNIVALPPFAYRIFKDALKAPCEYTFPTRAEAYRQRAVLNKARRKFRLSGHSLVPAFDSLVISGPQERPRRDGACDADGKALTEWFWRIGEDIGLERLDAQLRARYVGDPDGLAALDPPTQQPLAPAAARDESGLTPQEIAQLAKHQANAPRETQEDILNDVFGPALKVKP